MTADQEAIVNTLDRLVGDRSRARAAAEGGPATDRQLWAALAELGLTGMGLPEDLGGSGASFEDETIVTEALARFVAPVPLTTTVLAAHVLAAGTGPLAQTLAQDLASGRSIVGVCLSASRGADLKLEFAPDGGGDGGVLTGEIADLMDGASLDVILAPCQGQWWAVSLADPGVERTEKTTLDPTRRLASLWLQKAKAQAVSALDPEQVERMAWVLLAAESTGVAQACLDLAAAYSLERRQFGEPIGRFQAIKHKLTDALLAVEGARSAVHGAVRSMKDGLVDERYARMAKASATAAATTVAEEAVQIHGAIGNTWEHDLHMLLRRAKYSQLVLGSSDQHMDRLAGRLMDSPSKAERTSFESELSLEPQDRSFLQSLRDWLDQNATAERRATLRSGGVPARRAWQAEMAEAGWVGIHWPVEYGGRQASFVQQVLYHSELASRGLPPLIGNRGLSLTGPTIIVHGTPTQKQMYLEATRRSDILWASGLSEPGSGSDLASLRTRGEIRGDRIVINGQKIWTTMAHYADMLYTLVRTGPMTPKHGGITVVLIPLDSEGITIRPIRRMHGPADFNEVFFDEVSIPISNILGEVDQGWKVARTTLSHEHMTNFLGTQLRHGFFVEQLIGGLREREAADEIDYSLRRRLAQCWVNTQTLRLHGLRNVTRVAEGSEPGPEGSILKIFGQEEERRLYELALDLQGAAGLTSGRTANAFLSARAATVGGGTSEIHRSKIAERVLGMPRDPWADEDPAAAD